MSKIPPVYLGTVLPELNRWDRGSGKISFKMSDWAQRVVDDGFDGVELWQYHATDVDAEEVERIRTGPCPVKIFNAYCSCDPEDAGERRKISELALSLGAEGMKYNSGGDFERHDLYVDALKDWRAMLPETFRLLCECHRGSTMADTALANETLDRLGREHFGMILHGMDNDEATVRERFGAYGDRIQHIHANLSKDGLMPERAVCERLEFLSKLGFTGTYTIEFTEGIRSGLTQDELYANAVRDLKRLKRCLETVFR
jgi:GGDEF domain-containing protein